MKFVKAESLVWCRPSREKATPLFGLLFVGLLFAGPEPRRETLRSFERLI
jgi:hypothetical protein